MDSSRACRVGYALNPKKLRKSSMDNTLAASNPLPDSPSKKVIGEWRGGGLSDILDNIENDTVQFSIWDHEVPMHLQPDFDVIIHKLTEDIDRKESVDKMKALDNYLKHHPNTVIVDPIDSVRKVISRSRTCQHLSNIELTMGKQCPFRQPKYVVFEDSNSVTSSEDTLKVIAQHGLTFPIICKPVEACGTAISHHMVVIVSPEDINLMVRPCVVQQYYNHDANFFKVYVIDKEVMVFQRTSLPNLSIPAEAKHAECASSSSCKRSLEDDTCDNSKNGASAAKRIALRSVEFDSRKHYPTIEDFLIPPPSPAVEATSNGSSTVGRVKNTDVGSEGVSWKTKKKTADANSPASKIMTRSAAKIAEAQLAVQDSENSLVAQQPQSAPTSAVVTSVVTSETLAEDRSQEIIEQYMDEFRAAAVALQKEFGLTLFGFDVIIPNTNTATSVDQGRCSPDELLEVSQLELSKNHPVCEAGETTEEQPHLKYHELVVIDVNYFPSYKEVKDFPYRLKNFLKSRSVPR